MTDPHRANLPRMSLGDHLEELRARLIWTLLGAAVGCTLTLVFGMTLVDWICQPLYAAQIKAGMEPKIYGFKITTSFMLYLQVSLVSGLIVAAPWMLFQLWRFVESALYASERRFMVLVAGLSAVMTAAAVAFLYYVMLPVVLRFFLFFTRHYEGQTQGAEVGMQMLPGGPEYVSFVVMLALGAVIAFQLPVVLLLGAAAGLIDPHWLGRYRRYAILAIAVASALLTPADVLSMLLLAGPMYGLFELGLLLGKIAWRRRVAAIQGA